MLRANRSPRLHRSLATLAAGGAALCLVPCATIPAQAADPPQVRVTAGQARQIITVKAHGTYATVAAWSLRGPGWQRIVRTTNARIGANGLVAGAKRRQGSYTTPSGSFPLTEAFGIAGNPGTRMRYRHVTKCHWWSEDRRSRFYNTLVDACRTHTDYRLTRRGDNGSEHLLDYTGQYKYAVAIDFNRPHPVAGRGAGIFLHVNGPGATAGCVSVPAATMYKIMRWLRPRAHPRIVIR